MAAAQWPDVQRQYKIAKGVFGFSCAGHGGIIAVVGEADLNERAVELARQLGKTGYVLHANGRTYTSERYQIDASAPGVTEVIVGEEDCDWALVLLCANDPQAMVVGARGRYLAEHVQLEDVEETTRQWNPDFYEALTGSTIPASESYIKSQRKFEADNASNYVVRAAWGDWHEKVPEGMVGVVASRAIDNSEQYFLVPQDEYRARDGKHIITDEQVWEDHA